MDDSDSYYDYENWRDEDEDANNPHMGRGRTSKKKEIEEINALAGRLVELTPADLGRIGLPVALVREVETARSTGGRSSGKRQLKHLAGQLRRDSESVDLILAFLDGFDAERYRERAAFHNVEEWRDRICDPATGEEALADLRNNYPRINQKQLLGLAKSVWNSKDKRAAREIFRILREGMESV